MGASSRIEFVDRLRGLALVAMFFVHTAGAWLAPGVRESGYWHWSMRVSGMVAPVFMFLVGISVSLLAASSKQRGVDAGKVKKGLLIRGGRILLLGYGLHFLFAALEHFNTPWIKLLKVDILHAIGLSLAILPLIAWPDKKFNLRALLLFLIIPVIGLINYCLPLENWLPEGLIAYISTRSPLALFPFIPYATWTALGLFIGPLWVSVLGKEKAEKRFWLYMVLAAALAYALNWITKLIYYGFEIDQLGRLATANHGLVHVFYVKTAMVLLIFAAFGYTASFFRTTDLKALVLFGRTSLFCYSIHLVFVYHIGGSRFLGKFSPLEQGLGAFYLTLVMYTLAVAWTNRSKFRRLTPGES